MADGETLVEEGECTKDALSRRNHIIVKERTQDTKRERGKGNSRARKRRT